MRVLFFDTVIVNILSNLEFCFELCNCIWHLIVLFLQVMKISLQLGIQILILVLLFSILLFFCVELWNYLIHFLFQFLNFRVLFVLGCLEENQSTLWKLFHQHLMSHFEFIFVRAFLFIVFIENFKLFCKLTHTFELRLFKSFFNSFEFFFQESLVVMNILHFHFLFDPLKLLGDDLFNTVEVLPCLIIVLESFAINFLKLFDKHFLFLEQFLLTPGHPVPHLPDPLGNSFLNIKEDIMKLLQAKLLPSSLDDRQFVRIYTLHVYFEKFS